jgi:hypothetical protein
MAHVAPRPMHAAGAEERIESAVDGVAYVRNWRQ